MNAGQDPLIFNTKAPHPGELEYNRICPHLNGTTADIAPGYTVRLYCDMHSAAESWDRRCIDGLSSAEECAELCEARDYCHASFWKKAEGTCWLAHTRKLANKPKSGYVLMVPLEQSEVDLETCRAGKQECENDKAQLETELEELKEKLELCQSNDDVPDAVLSNYHLFCPEKIRQPITVAGNEVPAILRSWLVHTLAKPHSPQPNFPTFRQCLQEC
ncbi:hypothetical protein BDV33DRAFT_201390 [Aspergillus novoparasiticus]|uniref:Apple domain-containing protein n=1 Tax=Aspergillus novoparasiticus TaxID=986946 RepID=A0A5N6EXY4_9EURO|nr:hypothetical protein BDV33DRAFT_201390 [Aspergillus novoparasiticus]